MLWVDRCLDNADNKKDKTKRLCIKVINIEAAFLEGEAKTRNFLEYPEGLLELGFVTRKRQKHTASNRLSQYMEMLMQHTENGIFFETYKEYLEEIIGMIQSQVAPCILFKRNEDSETNFDCGNTCR